MQAAYAADAEFSDEVFTLRGGGNRRDVAHVVHGGERQGPR